MLPKKSWLIIVICSLEQLRANDKTKKCSDLHEYQSACSQTYGQFCYFDPYQPACVDRKVEDVEEFCYNYIKANQTHKDYWHDCCVKVEANEFVFEGQGFQLKCVKNPSYEKSQLLSFVDISFAMIFILIILVCLVTCCAVCRSKKRSKEVRFASLETGQVVKNDGGKLKDGRKEIMTYV